MWTCKKQKKGRATPYKLKPTQHRTIKQLQARRHGPFCLLSKFDRPHLSPTSSTKNSPPQPSYAPKKHSKKISPTPR